MFTNSRGGPIQTIQVNHVVRRAERCAGIRPCDVRLMRGALGWWLKTKGWHEPAIRDALGYKQIRELRILLRPYVNLQGVVLGSEFTGVDIDESESPCDTRSLAHLYDRPQQQSATS